MPISNHSERVSFLDGLARAAMPRTDSSEVSRRPARWWIFFMPGKVILWIEYMFPARGLGSVFGSARRRNVPLIQILYSLFFYLAVLAFAVYLLKFYAH